MTHENEQNRRTELIYPGSSIWLLFSCRHAFVSLSGGGGSRCTTVPTPRTPCDVVLQWRCSDVWPFMSGYVWYSFGWVDGFNPSRINNKRQYKTFLSTNHWRQLASRYIIHIYIYIAHHVTCPHLLLETSSPTKNGFYHCLSRPSAG